MSKHRQCIGLAGLQTHQFRCVGRIVLVVLHFLSPKHFFLTHCKHLCVGVRRCCLINWYTFGYCSGYYETEWCSYFEMYGILRDCFCALVRLLIKYCEWHNSMHIHFKRRVSLFWKLAKSKYWFRWASYQIREIVHATGMPGLFFLPPT